MWSLCRRRKVEALNQQWGVAATVRAQKNLPVDPRIIELSRIPAQAANQPQFTHAQRPSKTTVVPTKPLSHFAYQLRLPVKIGSNFRWDDAWSKPSLMLQGLNNVFTHLLRICEKHHGLIHVEHIIVDASIANTAHGTLNEEHGLCFVHIKHRHPVDW